MVEVGRVRLRAGRRALIGRHRRVALRERDPGQRHVELLGHELYLRGEETLTELALAGVGRHRPSGMIAIQPSRAVVRAAVDALGGGSAGRPGCEPSAAPKATISAPDRFQEAAAREPGRLERGARVGGEAGVTPSSRPRSGGSPRASGCAPKQRHRTPDSAWWMSSSVALGVRSTNALAGQDDAAQAEAALRRLLVDERLLDGMRPLGRAEAVERGDVGPATARPWSRTSGSPAL